MEGAILKLSTHYGKSGEIINSRPSWRASQAFGGFLFANVEVAVLGSSGGTSSVAWWRAVRGSLFQVAEQCQVQVVAPRGERRTEPWLPKWWPGRFGAFRAIGVEVEMLSRAEQEV